MFARRSLHSFCVVLVLVFLLVWTVSVPTSAQAVSTASVPLPVVDGFVIDVGPEVGSPRDGILDVVEIELGNTVSLTSFAEFQAVIEFDLGSIDPDNIQSAFLKITPIGVAFLPGTSSIPVELFGFSGDGSIRVDDFNAGSFITVFVVPVNPFIPKPMFLEVTEFLRSQQGFVGFTVI